MDENQNPALAEEAMDPEQEKGAERDQARKFLTLIQERETWLKSHWWKQAERPTKLYNAEDKNDVNSPYNILYSNTEVLLPSLYSAVPKPDVRARFKDTQLKPIPDVIERFLTVLADAAPPGVESLDNALSDATLSALIPGAGNIRLRYYEEETFPLQFESVPYNHFIPAKSRKWAKTPWIAYKHDMPKALFQKQMGISDEDFAAQYTPEASDDEAPSSCCIYEFWHKESRTVWFISEEWRDVLIQKTEDPLKLEHFFPTPGYLMLTAKPGQYEPIPLYVYYQNQAEELNRVTVRLNKVLSAIKVRGAYNPLLGDDLAKILSDNETENMLVAAAEGAALAAQGGFDKQIWLLPIEKLITVAQQLYNAREAIKQVIYEITGISDIIRGSSVASETATAQDLKNKWGTVRLRKMQTIVANYARDLFRLATDCGAKVIPAELWKQIIQLPIPLAAEKQAAQERMMQMQMMAQEAQMMGQEPPPPDPALQQMLSSPSLEEVLQKIATDIDRTFTVNIQTSSTIDLDTATDKAEVSEFMNAMGQLMAGLQPLAAMGPEGFAAAKEILVAVCQRYKFGLGIADLLKELQPPAAAASEGPPPGPSPEELEAMKAEMAFKMEEIAAKKAVLAAKTELSMLEIEAAKTKLQIGIEKDRISLASAQARAQAQAATPPKAQNASV